MLPDEDDIKVQRNWQRILRDKQAPGHSNLAIVGVGMLVLGTLCVGYAALILLGHSPDTAMRTTWLFQRYGINGSAAALATTGLLLSASGSLTLRRECLKRRASRSRPTSRRC